MKINNGILLVYICVVVLVRGQLSPGTLPPEFQFINAMILFAFLTIAAVQLLMHLAFRVPHNVMVAFFSALILGTIGANEFLYLSASRQNAEQQPLVAALAGVSPSPDVVELPRGIDGHFVAVAQVNSQDVRFLVDTGSSLVLLRHADAVRLGIDPEDLTYSIPLTTAAGVSSIAPYRFDEIRINGIVIRDVRGGVAMPGALYSSLLGMSFIEELDQMVIQKDRIMLIE